jgi:hypothetical protein
LKQDHTQNKDNQNKEHKEKLTLKVKTTIQEIKGYNLINGAKL